MAQKMEDSIRLIARRMAEAHEFSSPEEREVWVENWAHLEDIAEGRRSIDASRWPEDKYQADPED